MEDNISKFYKAFSSKYKNFNNEQEFRDYLKGAKRENIDKLYNAFNSKYSNFGSSDEMISYLGWSDSSSGQDAPVQAGTPQSRERTGAAPAATTPAQTNARPVADNSKWAVPQSSQWNEQMEELGKSVMPGEPISMPERKSREPEVNPFPYRGGLEKELEELREKRAEVAAVRPGEDGLIAEYERRLKEFHNSLDPTSKKTKENEKWLREHKEAYQAAMSSGGKKEQDALTGQIQDILTVQAKRELKEAQEENRKNLPGGAAYEYGMSLSGLSLAGGIASLVSSVAGGDNAIRAKAGEIYRMAGQELNKGSKYDPGFRSDDSMERAWTAINQFAEGAANEVDSGSITMGLSEGSALWTARKVGDKYNEVVSNAVKDMKMSNGDMNALISFIDTNGRKLQSLVEELDKEGADLKTMNDTYEDMVRRGDPNAKKYGAELQKKLDAYNKRVKEEYDPLRAQYDNDIAAYQKINDAIDAAVNEKMTDGEMAMLDALEKYINAKTLRSNDVSTAASAGAGAEQSAEFMLDFILTGGVTRAGEKAATKIATRRLMKKLGAEAVKDMVVKPGLGLRFATGMATEAVRTGLQVTRNLQEYGNQLAEYVGKDSFGRYNFDRTHVNAAANTLLSRYIENWSEGFGGYFSAGEQALFRSVTGKSPVTAIGKTLRGYSGSIGNYLDYGKFDGMLNEMLEEVVGSGLNSMTGWLSNKIDPDGRGVGDEEALKQFFAGDNIATLTLSFLPMSVIGAATNVSAYLNMRERYNKGEQMLQGFVESGKLKRSELEYLTANLSEKTPEQIKDRIIEIADIVRERNGGALPSDFAKDLIGYVEGTFAMENRSDAWDESREKMAVVDAYSRTYSNPNLGFAWDVDQAEKDAKQAALAAGFTEEELDEKDSFILAREAASIRESEPGRSSALSNYAAAKAQAEGLRNGYERLVNEDVDQMEKDVRDNIDNDGVIVTATMNVNGEQTRVFVKLSQGATIGPDGRITTPSGADGLVGYSTSISPESEESEESQSDTVKASELSDVMTIPTDEYIALNADVIRGSAESDYEKAKGDISVNGMSRAISQRVGTDVVVSGNGAYMPVRVERMTNGGRKAVIKGDKNTIKAIAQAVGLNGAGSNRLEIEVEKLYPHLQTEADGSLTTYQEEETETAPAQERRQAPQVSPEELPGTQRNIFVNGVPTRVTVDNVGGDGVWFHYTDAEGNERNGDMPVNAFMESLVPEDEQPTLSRTEELLSQRKGADVSSIVGKEGAKMTNIIGYDNGNYQVYYDYLENGERHHGQATVSEQELEPLLAEPAAAEQREESGEYGPVISTFDTNNGTVEVRAKTSEKDGVKTTKVVATRNGSEVATRGPQTTMPVPEGFALADVPEGAEVVGISELRESQDGTRSATALVRLEDGSYADMESRLVEKQDIPLDKNGIKVYDHPDVTPERAFRELFNGIEPGSRNESNRLKYIGSKARKAAQAVADAENRIAGIRAKKDAVEEWEIGEDEELDAFEQRKAAEKKRMDDEIAQVEAGLSELQRKAAHWAAVRDMAGAVSSERKDAKLVEAADAWTQRTGVKVRAFRTPDEIDDKTVRDALAKGERVGGWYNPRTGEVGLYLPNLADEAEVAKTFIHEVISHKGLRDMLGKENYDALCDKVWDQLMSEEDRQKYLEYNSHLKGSEEFLRRAAADEWIAHFSETLGLEENKNLFDKFVDFVKEFLDRILGEDAKISKDDIATLLRSSLARYESERKADTRAQLYREGIAAETQAAQLDDNAIRFNIKTEESVEQKIRDFAKSKEGRKLGWTDDQIESIIGETADLMRAIHAAVSGDKYYDEWAEKVPTIKVDWRDGVEKPTVTWSRANIEYKYDMSADLLCINNEGLEAVLASPTMVELMLKINETANDYKEGFTSDDYLRLYETLRDMGFVVPCKGCFDAAVRLKSLPTVSKKFVELVNKIIDERNANPVAFDRKVRAKAGDNATISGLPGSANNMEDAIRTGVVGDNLTEHISWAQLMSAEGQTKALSDWGGIFRAWERTGAGRPKDKLLPEPWSGDIVNTTTTIIGKFGEKTPSYRAISVNQGTGLRRNSHSEFRPLLAIDEIQFMREAFIRGLTVFKYMKELDDVRLFGKLGVKFNMSFFPAFVEGAPAAGLDANGDYIAAEESVGGREFEYVGEDGKTHYDGMKGWQEAMKYINKDVSLSSVIFSIPHLIKAFTDVPTKSDPRGIWGSLIPFHATGATFASLKRQGLGEARALGHSFEEALTDYGKGVTNFEAVQNDMFGEGWEVVEGKKAGTKVEPGHKLEFSDGTHYYNAGLGLHLFRSKYIFDSEMDEHPGEFASVKEYAEKYGHPYSIDYNDKVRELGTGTAYQDASDYYIDMLRSLGLVPRFDFEVPEDIFLMMCSVVNVDPRHPKLGWKGEGHSWSPVDSEAYYSLWCDYGMIDPDTGMLAPHNPVGMVDAEGNRVFQLPENTVDIIKDGVARYSERKDREAARELDAIEEFARRTVAEGKLKQEDADAIISQARAEQESPDVAADGSWTHFRKLEDPAKIEELENGEWEEDAYRAVQFVPDPNGEWEYDLGDGNGVQKGNVYPPMSAQTEKGEWRNPIQKGVIEESEEAPGKAFLKNGKWVFRLHKGNGKYVDAAYNPYIHSSDTMLNDQFSEAQSRGNLVVMRVAVPKSELDGENLYQAEKAKDHVGRHDWKAGPIQGELTGTRTVYLSRYDKPMELMPIEKVGESVAKMLEGQVETMPTNVVWPQLRAELEKRGMKFVETDNKGKLVSGENAGKTWKQVYGKKKPAKKQKNSDTGTRFRIAYHGSPNKFEEFDTNFVGDGEGHQSHGWGIYVSLGEGTARRYGYLGDRDKVVYQGQEPPTYYAKELVATMMMEMAQKGTSFDKAKKSMLDALNYYESKREDAGNYWRNSSYKREIDFFENLKEDDFKINESHRNLYKVDIPDDTGENYIDEQKNLKKPMRVKIAEAIRALPAESWQISEDDAKLFREYTAEQLADKIEKGPINGERVYSELSHGLGSPRAASEFLSNAGFDGIKYVGGVDGPCAVIFKADDVKIEEHTRFRRVAPNGRQSNLTDEQWEMVRSPEFKAWFGDWLATAELQAIEERKQDWLSKDNIDWATGKSLDEITERFGDGEEPVAYIPVDLLDVFGDEAKNITDNRVYSSKAYYIDHAANHHPAVDPEKYRNIQQVINEYDHVKRVPVDGKESVVFTKKIDRWNAVSVQLEVTPDGHIVWHKNYYEQKKEPYKSYPDIRPHRRLSSEGGTSSISPADQSAAAISLESRGDDTNVRNFLIPTNNFSKVVDENGEPRVVYHGGSFGRESYDGNSPYIWEGSYGNGWFATNKSLSDAYIHDFDQKPISVFLNIRNPFAMGDTMRMLVEDGKPTAVAEDYAQRLGVTVDEILRLIQDEYSDYVERDRGVIDTKAFTINRNPDFAKLLVEKGYDGATDLEYDGSLAYMTTDPAQIKSATENNGEFSSENPDIRFRITPEQDKEYMDAVNSGDMEKAQEMVDEAAEAAGYTTRGYHGTTHNFTIFDRSKGNAEGDWGKGFYFTTSRDDADVNYGTDEGPDLTNRIELLAENMEWMDGYEDMDYDERLEKAREMLAGDNPHVVSAAIRMENPVVIDSHQGAKETFFDYNSGYNYETDEYEDEESGLLLDFINAWNEELNEWEWEGNYVSPAEILEYADDGGLTASQLEKKAREILDSAGIQNSAGELASGEFLRSVFERMGFDGIIDENVNMKFGSQRQYGRGMDGMDYDTAHIIAFTPGQIKQTDPVTYDDNGNVIPLSERFNPENNDIRFSKRGTPEYEEESQKLFDRAKEHFGTTSDLREAGYALPDGTMLDFSGRHWSPGSDNGWMNGRRQVDHRDIHELNYEEDGNTPSGFKTGMQDFIQRGAVRLNSNVINLANKPTKAQEDIIRSVIYRANGNVDVDFGDGYDSDHYASYERVAPSRVINDIRGYYDDGVKPSGNTMFRKALSKEEQEKLERIAAAERIVTEKTLDSMPQAIGAGVMRVSQKQMPSGHKTDKGYYNPATNTVSVCMDNVLDERDAVATVIHETVGRKGLREIFGEQYRESMASSYAALDAEGRAWVNGYMLRNGLQPGDEGILRGMQEYMVVQAERGEGSFLDAVNDILSQAVDLSVGTEGFRFTNRELAYILRASFEHAKNPGWLDTPAGKAQDTLWKREYGINESDPNRPTDPDGPDAGTRFRRGYVGNAVADYERENKRWQNVAVMEIQNADLPVKLAYEAVLKEKYGDKWEDKMKSLPENEDYLMRHNLSSSRADTENFEFMTFRMNPMLEKVAEVQQKLAGKKANTQKLRDAYERVLNYLYAVSGLERNEWKRNNGGEDRDYSGITALMGYTGEEAKENWKRAEEEARAMIAEFESDVNDQELLNELWDSIRACTDFSLDHAYKYGLLTKEEYERLRGTETQPRMWNYYIPLRGFKDETAEEAFDYVGYTALDSFNNGVVKEADGRWSLADSPLANIQNIAQREIVQGNENWARQALLRFVRNTGKNSLLSERDVWYVRDADTGEWTKAVPEGEDIDKFEKDMREKQKNGNAKKDKARLDIDRIMANRSHENQHLIRVKTGGVEHAIWVHGDPAMAKAVTGIGRQSGYQHIRAANRVVSNMFTTYSLDFTAKNLLRDTLYSRMALLAKEDRKYRWTFEKNWWANGGVTGARMIRLAAMWDSGELKRKEMEGRLSKKEQLFIDFMRDGGQTGYTVIRSVEKLKKDIEKQIVPSLLSRAKKKVVDGTTLHVAGVDVPVLGLYTWGVRTLNEAFELLTRFTAYETSREMGRSGQRAAYDAKEISVNFNRRGAQSNNGVWGRIAAYLGGTHYFFNAGVQGFDNFLRLFKTSPKTMTAESIAVMSLGFLTPILNSLIGAGGGDGDDDKRIDDNWYWNLPEWVRRNNIVIGLKKDFYIAIPLPVEFRALYGLGDITNSVFYSHTYANPSPGPGDWKYLPNPGNVAMDIMSTVSSILPVNPIEGYNGKSVDLVEAVARSFTPDLGMFIVDWITNKDYTGRQLVKENMFSPETPASQGAYASTPKALVDACQWMGEHFGVDIPPGIVRDGLNNYLGGYYKFAEDIAKQMFTDDDRPGRWDDIPFLSGFTGHIDEDRKITYVNSVLYEYKDVMENVVRKMNLYDGSSDINPKQAFTEEETLPDKAKIQKLMLGKDYNIAKMYYLGMEDEDTGETEKVVKVHQKGKNAGKKYKATVKIKIPGVNSKKKAWQDARDKWKAEKKGTPEEAKAYADVTNAWHEYYNAAADLADKLMKYEYEGIQ